MTEPLRSRAKYVIGPDGSPLTVAKLLKAVVDKEQPQLIILGKQSIDGDNNQSGQMLAALAGYAQGTFASELNVEGEQATVTREIDGGLQTLKLKLPAVITTDLRLNEPTTPDELGVDVSAKVQQLKVEPPPERSAGIKVADVAELVDKLKNEAKVI